MAREPSQAGSLLAVPASFPVDAAPPSLLTGQLVQACFAQVLGHSSVDKLPPGEPHPPGRVGVPICLRSADEACRVDHF